MAAIRHSDGYTDILSGIAPRSITRENLDEIITKCLKPVADKVVKDGGDYQISRCDTIIGWNIITTNEPIYHLITVLIRKSPECGTTTYLIGADINTSTNVCMRIITDEHDKVISIRIYPIPADEIVTEDLIKSINNDIINYITNGNPNLIKA